MSSNGSKPPLNGEIMKELEKFKAKQSEQHAANAKNPNYHHLPDSYPNRCKQWAKRDLWTLSEAANLLAGTDPIRPTIKGHDKLNNSVNTITQWLKHSAVRQEGGMLSKRYLAKDVITWAIEKDIPVPDALLVAMGHTPKTKESAPKEEQTVHGNVLANAKKRERVLGAAVRALVEYPAQCKGKGEKYTGTSIARVLEQQQDKLFEDHVAPYALQGMADIINGYLNPGKNKKP